MLKKYKWKVRVGSLFLGLIIILTAWHFITTGFIENQKTSQLEIEELQFSNDVLSMMATVNQNMIRNQLEMDTISERLINSSVISKDLNREKFNEKISSMTKQDRFTSVEAVFLSTYGKIRLASPQSYNHYVNTSLSDFLQCDIKTDVAKIITLPNGDNGIAITHKIIASDGFVSDLTVVFSLENLSNDISNFLDTEYNYKVHFESLDFEMSSNSFNPSRPVFTEKVEFANRTIIIEGQLKDKMVNTSDDLMSMVRYGSLALIIVVYLSMVFLLYSNNFLSSRVNAMIYYDALTKLPNRRKLTRDMRILLRKTDDFSVFFIDIFNFKAINDARGHKVGDEILNIVGSKLREHTSQDVQFYRWGGDEFIAIINLDIYDSRALLNAMFEVIRENIVDHTGTKHELEFTAGGTTFKESGSNIDQSLLNADYAMQELRKENERGIKIYNDEIGEQLKRRIHIESLIHEAIAKKDFRVVFQPLVNPDGSVASLEALVRWSLNEEKIFPDEFIPIAEQLNVIDKLDLIVIEKAIEGISKIYQAGFTDIKVGVNVSITELNESFIEAITAFMENYGVGPDCLIIEITERIDLAGEDYRLEILEKLRNAGVVIALDDFGSGFSSMMRLVNMPFDKIKIDKGLIDYCALQTSKNIVANIIDMIHVMDMTAVAEGVETEDQVKALQGYGVDYIQGYYYSRPLNLPDVIEFIASDERKA